MPIPLIGFCVCYGRGGDAGIELVTVGYSEDEL